MVLSVCVCVCVCVCVRAGVCTLLLVKMSDLDTSCTLSVPGSFCSICVTVMDSAMHEAVHLSVYEFCCVHWTRICCVCVTVIDMKYVAVKSFGSALWLILQTAEC
jgi:hypothetical protein